MSEISSDSISSALNRTPLYAEHLKLGAKMVPFAGFSMPLQYEGIVSEHLAVRHSAGVFDVSHMGELLVTGREAEALLGKLLCNDVRRLKDGRAQYSAITNERGGVVDDVIVYRYNPESFLICVNASNQVRDLNWFNDHNTFEATVEDQGAEFAQVAVQGPKAIEKLESIPGLEGLSAMSPFSFQSRLLAGMVVLVARTGYTGEDGVEIFIPAPVAVDVWRAILSVEGISPCGLGARDSLRLEAAYPLHGHELEEDISALESGLDWIIKLEGRNFIGSTHFSDEKSGGIKRQLVGFRIMEGGIARQGDSILNNSGEIIGTVTSGTKTPLFEKAIGLARVESPFAPPQTPVYVAVRGRQLRAEIVKTPFYSRLSRSSSVSSK